MSKRIDEKPNEYWWRTIPSFLRNNIINGGLSDILITEKNEIYAFAMIPQYATLLLKSNAILPVIILDGTFQSSIFRGVLIIVMCVSSNRTNIPLGWAWGPEEDEETVKLILNLIKETNDEIETIISDEGKAIKSAIKEVFPNVIHKFCAWHIAKQISDKGVRQIFWSLLRADHPLIFQDLIRQLCEMHKDNLPEILSKIYSSGKINIFCRFFEGVKENELITSSPCESINSEIRKLKTEMPLRVFHFLEIIGFNRCLDLVNLTTKMTPYYSKRLAHLNNKAQRLMIIEKESFSTSRTIVDRKYPHEGIRWEVNTRDYNCVCGKYTDRGFPCAHMIKAFQDLNQSFEHCVTNVILPQQLKLLLKI